MSQIVEKMRQEVMNLSARFEEQTKGTKDEYNIYREHIQYVHKCAVKNISICKFFCGVKYLDSVLCSYPHGNKDE